MNAANQAFAGRTLKTMVLRLLAQQGRMYGYEITQAVEEQAGGAMPLLFGALYPVLHKLEEEGLLTTQSQEVDGRRRKYYWLTRSGAETAGGSGAQSGRFADRVRLLIRPVPDGLFTGL